MTLDAQARRRLEQLVAEITAEPERVRVHMPAAARTVARGAPDPADPFAPATEDLVRVELLAALATALGDDPDRLRAEVNDLYRYGDAAEKRAVLRALPRLGLGDEAQRLVADALRTNDVRLVAAAMGPCATQLGAAAWRQGVLKCLFVGVPLSAVHDLDPRVDEELADMAASYMHERIAAGRSVPDDVWLVLGHHPDAVTESGLLAELDSDDPTRRAAAQAALSGRPAPEAARSPQPPHSPQSPESRES